MRELTDLEICKRIAEIEGVKVRICGGDLCMLEVTGSSLMKIPTTEYNPLTDDALSFRLMIKYKVRTHWLWEENDGTPHYEAYINEDSSDINYDKSPNKAILLAIIEANNEN